jgi:hypothetical protein
MRTWYFGVLFAIVLAVGGVWAWKVHLSPEAKARRATAIERVAELREIVLSGAMLRQEGVPEAAEVFVMEWQVGSSQLATLVSFDDGTTSIYFSSGAGVIGAGEIDTVKPVAKRFRKAFDAVNSYFSPVNTWAPPDPDKYVFYRVSKHSIRATPQYSTEQMRETSDVLRALEGEGQRLITAIRNAKEPNGGGK